MVAKNSTSSLYQLFELMLVLIIGFGLFWYSDYLALNSSQAQVHTYSTGVFIELVVAEIFLFSVILLILKLGQWSLKDFNLKFTFSMLAVGALLVVLRIGIGYTIEFILTIFGISSTPMEYQMNAGLISIFLALIINSIYEEFLLLGYLFKRLEKLNPILVIIISMIIRESYHLYQGWEKLPMAISIGLVFGWYYYKHKKLWPPIIAHAIGNILAFMALHYGWGWL